MQKAVDNISTKFLARIKTVKFAKNNCKRMWALFDCGLKFCNFNRHLFMQFTPLYSQNFSLNCLKVIPHHLLSCFYIISCHFNEFLKCESFKWKLKLRCKAKLCIINNFTRHQISKKWSDFNDWQHRFDSILMRCPQYYCLLFLQELIFFNLLS